MHVDAYHRTTAELTAGLPEILGSPHDGGVLRLIVRRPAVDEREILAEARLDPDEGLVGDTWQTRGSRHTPDGTASGDRQITIMNARAAALIAGDPERWALAGDQLYLDLDLSRANLPAGTRLRLGDAVVEITDAPHNGCAKFARRFGADAGRFVNVGAEVRDLRLRGIFARVAEGGTIRVGDRATKTS